MTTNANTLKIIRAKNHTLLVDVAENEHGVYVTQWTNPDGPAVSQEHMQAVIGKYWPSRSVIRPYVIDAMRAAAGVESPRRRRTVSGGSPSSVYLNDADKKALKLIGGGNISIGVVSLLEIYRQNAGQIDVAAVHREAVKMMKQSRKA